MENLFVQDSSSLIDLIWKVLEQEQSLKTSDSKNLVCGTFKIILLDIMWH